MTSRSPRSGSSKKSRARTPKAVQRKLTVPSDTTYLAAVRRAVIEAALVCKLPRAQANLIALAVDEAVANIMEHAYPENTSGGHAVQDVEVVLSATSERFQVAIRDHGVGFDPREHPDVNMGEHVKSGRTGGLGVFLIRRIMDEIRYSFKPDNGPDAHNELVLVKYIKKKAQQPEPVGF